MINSDVVDMLGVEEEEDSEIKQSRKLNSYTSAYKLEAIKHAKLVFIHSASTKFHVNRKRILDWIKSEKKLHLLTESSPSGKIKKRLQGGGRPLKYKDLDNELSIWVRERRLKKLRVSRRLIQQHAERTFNRDQDDGDFKASQGWLNKFIARHNFRLRVPTTVCQNLRVRPKMSDKLVDWWEDGEEHSTEPTPPPMTKAEWKLHVKKS